MKKFRSYGIYLCLFVPLFGAAAARAQDAVDRSAFREQTEMKCAIDEIPSGEFQWDGTIDRHRSVSCRPTLAGEKNAEELRQMDGRSELAGEQKLDGPFDESVLVTDFEKFTTEGSCIRLGEAGTRPRCPFPNRDVGFLHPRPFTASEGAGSDDGEIKSPPRDRFHWKSAFLQSAVIQGLQHAYALGFQEKTRRALKGPFFKDYINSVKALAGWDDGNRFFTNYIAHPAQGGMTGFIFVQNHDRAKRQKFGESKQYWKDRLTAFAWSTAWSTNWELGPISQSSIGNLGLHGGMAYVDLVITPTVGTGWLVGEEALDRYVIRHIEKRSFLFKVFARTFLNPMRAVANTLRLKEPWYRDRPPGH